MAEKGQLYVLAIPDDPDAFSFFTIEKEDGDQYILRNVKKSIFRGGILIISKEQFEEYKFPLEMLEMDVELMNLIHKYGSAAQQKIVTFSELAGTRRGTLVSICGILCVILEGNEGYIYSADQFDLQWKAAIEEVDLQKWLVIVNGNYQPHGTNHYETFGLKQYLQGKELQLISDEPYVVARVIMDSIASSVIMEGLEIHDGMTEHVMDYDVEFHEVLNEQGNPVVDLTISGRED